MANPSSKWDYIPVWGVYLQIDNTPSGGVVTFSLNQRVTRVDGRLIYPDGASVSATIGNTAQQDATIRSTVRSAWRAADATAAGGSFDGTAWDTWWDTIIVPAAIFTAFPASDDPDIVQTGYTVQVKEALTSGGGKTYGITPMTVHLDLPIPGINLGTVEVPPGSPSVPAPMYAKGVAGGVAALNYAGQVIDASGDPVTGTALRGTSSRHLGRGSADHLAGASPAHRAGDATQHAQAPGCAACAETRHDQSSLVAPSLSCPPPPLHHRVKPCRPITGHQRRHRMLTHPHDLPVRHPHGKRLSTPLRAHQGLLRC